MSASLVDRSGRKSNQLFDILELQQLAVAVIAGSTEPVTLCFDYHVHGLADNY